MEIKKEEIIGYALAEETVCPDCISKSDLENITQDEIITENGMDDEVMVFCDGC